MIPLMPGILARQPNDPARQYIDRMTSVDAGLISDIATFIDSLVSDGLWDKFDYLSVIQDNQTDTKRNLKSSSYTSTLSGGVFTADSGYVIGASGYIHTGFDPAVELFANMVNDSFCVMGYITTNSSTGIVAGRDKGSGDDWVKCQISSSVLASGLSWSSASNAKNTETGLHATSRVSSTELIAYTNGFSTTNSSSSRSGAFIDGSGAYIAYGASHNGTLFQNQLQENFVCWAGGDGFSVAQLDSFNTILEEYLTARGAI